MSYLQKALSGMAWTTISTVVRSIVSLLQISILTSYLSREDFALVAICNLFIGFTQLFLDLGISVGILHKQEVTKNQLSSLYWLNCITGVFLFLVLCCIAPLVERVYDEPSLSNLLVLLSTTILFSSIGSQHRIMQQKKMRFKHISIIEILSSLCTIILAVVLVKNGFGIYSLIYSTIFNSLFSNLLFSIIGFLYDRNISFHFSIKETFPFLKIGVFSMGSEILNYFSREFDIIIISAMQGKDSLGLYSLCKKIIVALYEVINPIVTKVMTPMLSELQGNVVKVRQVYYDLTQSVALINFPIFYLIAIFSLGILNFLYGEQYIDGHYILSLLALYYGFLTTGNPVGSLQTAMGKTNVGFYWNCLRLFFCALAIFVGSCFFSIEGVVVCLIITAFITQPIFWKITISPLIGGKFRDYVILSFKPLLIFLIPSLFFYILLHSSTNLILIVCLAIIYLIIIISIISLLFKESYLYMRLLSKFLNKFFT